ncbi:hypothetical protein G7Y89_g5383 [Cudoniella acicularis]|uniref:Uncharacterized protein n=1 Tax=Cudoniella acicularis TaxID=354080 RepID=A0A8H4RQR2_9HELO|nr:hypothetical protein G7Y89_g5383 [Cudoniella acicularis]
MPFPISQQTPNNNSRMGDISALDNAVKPKYSVALHAGAAESWFGDAQTQKNTEAFLANLIKVAEQQLMRGTTSIDVITDIVAALEDYPQFNAGKGSAVNIDGFHELEAAIVNGENSEYRAAACLSTTKNPIRLAHSMLAQESPCFLVGPSADAFAVKNGLEIVKNEYFSTPSRKGYWEAKIKEVRAASEYHGTVGAVALDVHGNLAAGNSTGGLMFKSVGRIGDTCVVGAGIWADGEVAIACSGSGEAILKATVASRAACDVRNGKSIGKAIEDALLKSADLFPTSSCGIIGIYKSGEISIHCNSRIFAVASASSVSSTINAGIIPSTIPLMKSLVCYEDDLLRAGMSKYPTMPNQMVIEWKGYSPFETLERHLFLEYLQAMRTIAKGLQKYCDVKRCALNSAAGRQTSIFPIPDEKSPKSNEVASIEETDSGLTLQTHDLESGYQASFYSKSSEQYLLVKVEIRTSNPSLNTSPGFLSLEIDAYNEACSALWKTCQILRGEFKQDLNSFTFEINTNSGSGSLATFSRLTSTALHFPAPAPFHDTYPGYLTTELGRRASNLLELSAIVDRVSNCIREVV